MISAWWPTAGTAAVIRPAAGNCIHFLEETFTILKNKTVGLFRADSGFCSETILKFIEDRNIAYVVACKLYANLQREVYNIQEWNAIGEGLWISEISYKQGGWSKARRMVIVKQNEEIRPRATGKKLKTLFSSMGIEDDKVYKTRYHAFVTSQTLPAVEI